MVQRERRRLRMGMVGGGSGAFIGAVHRRAAMLDGDVELVAGAFSSDREKGLASGRSMFVADKRNYRSWQEMADAEAALPDDQRIDFVAIVTPNELHFPVASRFCEIGVNVFCEKPLTLNLAEAVELERIARASGVIFGVAYTYTGYPMIKHARALVNDGALGEIGRVAASFTHGNMLGLTGPALAARWRADPVRSGLSNSVADIGTHCEHLIRYVTGLETRRLCAVLHRAPGQMLDNEATIILDFEGGARGLIQTSQLIAGDRGNLKLTVHGDLASLEWAHGAPEELWLLPHNGVARLYRKGDADLAVAAKEAARLPPGHPEGFIEAFANVYSSYCGAVRARQENRPATVRERDFPGLSDGRIGMAFVETVVSADASDEKWRTVT